uniref:Uncharacterized protein n=1 Tax=Candidatus Methanogaster sp. ANME-2c ERB4 TaxID=2759911 RepID=A0A7G9YN26_9EURY|nr:hypothetical protein HONBAIEO_00031 [Methanosarcinales archaeon ANME-2c ERB4]QNO49410.1 hypothetical protein JHKIABMC_00016 [Methanosarcinales archaeon ANME-2c ERB4]
MISIKICNKNSLRIVIGITISILLLSGVEVIRAEVGLPDFLQVPGRLEANGTLFEMNNNEYLNITLSSSEPINLILESISEMITMNVDSINGASSTIITMSGFLPDTTYHKYEDNYHDHEIFITDVNGNYTYEQDLSIEHLVFIQSKAGTKFINDNDTGGDCSSIGIWDPSEKTCTLTTDLTETIQIDSDGIILDGNGHLVTGSKTGRGVYFTDRKYVTIKNLNVTQFSVGIEIYNSSFSNIKENNVFNNTYDFRIIYSNDNEIINSATSVGDAWGIQLCASNNNIISGNNIIGAKRGIWLHYSNNNILSNNTVPNNWYGSDCIRLASSNNNTVIDNSITPILNNLSMKGIRLMYSNNNVVSGNKVSNNLVGILVESSDNNTIYNNCLNNTNNAITTGNNTWNTTKTVGTNIMGGHYIGGNFWAQPDGNGYSQKCIDSEPDGICDLPYKLKSNNIDFLPLIYKTALLIPVNVDIKPGSLNKASQSDENTVTGYIEVPGFDVNDIDLNTVKLITNHGMVSAQLSPSEVGDYDNDGIPDRMVQFDRQAVIGILDVGENVRVIISGKIAAESFEGIDEIQVINSTEQILKFPTMVLPVIAVIGLLFRFQRRKGKIGKY